MKTLKTALYTVFVASLFSSTVAFASDKIVSTAGLDFEPMVVQISPGDTVNWTNMSNHNVDIKYAPEGANKFKTKIGKNFSHKFTKSGIYVYQSDPHKGLGMGGVVIVGKPVNLSALESNHASGALEMIVQQGIKAAKKDING